MATKKETTINIKPMQLETVEFTIVGDTPLIVHNWSTKYAEEPVRAFVPVTFKEKTSYKGIEVVLKSEDGREQLLSRAMAELRAFERKYNSLEELAGVFAAIREVA